ncbi:hypothetical protein AGMMS49925_08430 [Deltaproteobacteria bacterium]|nr:hypothetical protein AGMMS49925_08430 [Deltaproteobacteria bacterium]
MDTYGISGRHTIALDLYDKTLLRSAAIDLASKNLDECIVAPMQNCLVQLSCTRNCQFVCYTDLNNVGEFKVHLRPIILILNRHEEALK